MYTHFQLRGAVYANSFPSPIKGLTKAKAWIREHLSVTRLPNGTEVW